MTIRTIAMPVISVISIVVSNFSIVASVALYVLVPLLLALPAAIRPTTRTSSATSRNKPRVQRFARPAWNSSRQTGGNSNHGRVRNAARYVTCRSAATASRSCDEPPEKRNALSLDLMRELDATFRTIGDDGSVRAVVLCGKGAASPPDTISPN